MQSEGDATQPKRSHLQGTGAAPCRRSSWGARIRASPILPQRLRKSRKKAPTRRWERCHAAQETQREKTGGYLDRCTAGRSAVPAPAALRERKSNIWVFFLCFGFLLFLFLVCVAFVLCSF